MVLFVLARSQRWSVLLFYHIAVICHDLLVSCASLPGVWEAAGRWAVGPWCPTNLGTIITLPCHFWLWCFYTNRSVMSSTALLTIMELLCVLRANSDLCSRPTDTLYVTGGLFWSWTSKTVKLFLEVRRSLGVQDLGWPAHLELEDGKAGTHQKISHKSAWILGLLPEKQSHHIWSPHRLLSLWSPAFPKMKT